jgi:hypothetical protein
LLRKILDSPWLYFALAGLLIVAAVLSQIRFDPADRPIASIDRLDTLREEARPNVVFVSSWSSTCSGRTACRRTATRARPAR